MSYLPIGIISIIERVISVVIILLFITPLQFKQFKVKDSLIRLRHHLLWIGVLVLAIDAVSLITIFLRLTIDSGIYQTVLAVSSIISGIFFMGLAYFGYRIYHDQYTD